MTNNVTRTIKSELLLLGMAIVSALSGTGTMFSAAYAVICFFGSFIQPKLIPFDLALVALTVVLGFVSLRSGVWTYNTYKRGENVV